MDVIELAHRAHLKSIARQWLGLLRAYFRIEISGVENIPLRKGALIVPNHSGFAGFDAVLLTYIIKRETRRRPRILAHRAYFDLSETLKEVSQSLGLRKASISEGIEILKKEQLLVIFPEGETGNFKSFVQRYHLQKFHTGYLRMAIESQKPIVPCVVVGAEDAHLNWGNIDLTGFVKGLRIPMPINLLPLPSKWRIRFLPVIEPAGFDPKILSDPKALAREADAFRKVLQKEILVEKKKRRYTYFTKTGSVEEKFKNLKREVKKQVRKRIPKLSK